jgi:hypothetical protein
MRRPAAGGSPEIVLEEPLGIKWDYWCPPQPRSQCVLGQQEGKDFVFYSLDPVRGRGQQLGTIEASLPGTRRPQEIAHGGASRPMAHTWLMSAAWTSTGDESKC